MKGFNYSIVQAVFLWIKSIHSYTCFPYQRIFRIKNHQEGGVINEV